MDIVSGGTAMPLQGSLGHLGLADLLQSGLTGTGGGTLHLSNGAERALLFLSEEGLHLLEPDVIDPNDLVRAFLRRGVLQEATVRAQGRAATQGGVVLIDQLLECGALEQDTLMEVLAGVAEDTILDLLTWDHGTFRFDEGTQRPESMGLVGRIAVDPGGVLLRAAQRVDERAAIARDVGMRAALFLPTGSPAPMPEDEDDYSQDVLQRLDGVNVLDEIALDIGIGRFSALKAAHNLLAAGAARLPSPEELGVLAVQRLERNQLRAARAVCLHWNEQQPQEVAPLQTLAEIASRRGNLAEELAAISGQGTLLLQAGNADAALQLFEDALRKTDYNEDLLQGARLAAKDVGRHDVYADATLRLGVGAISKGNSDQASILAKELMQECPEQLGGPLLLGRAAAERGESSELESAADAASALLDLSNPTRLDREAAAFFREALSRFAPKRGDLMKKFRIGERSKGMSPRARRLALVGCLVVLLGVAGVVLWPAGPATRLGEAQEAIAAGDRTSAVQILTEIIETWPDSPEADEAFRLQTQYLAPQPSAANAAEEGPATPVRVSPAQLAKNAYLEALLLLPEAKAFPELEKALVTAGESENKGVRQSFISMTQKQLPAALRKIEQEVRDRQDVLAQAGTVAIRHKRDAAALRKYLDQAESVLGTAFPDRIAAMSKALDGLDALEPGEIVKGQLERLAAIERQVRAFRESYRDDLHACERSLLELDLTASFEACQHQASKLLARGDIDGADALYADTERYVTRIAEEDFLEPLRAGVKRRRIDDYVSTRRARIAGIRETIARAKTRESEGDYKGALEILVGLVKSNWQIPLQGMIEVPLHVTSVPAGARILVNGEFVGTTPQVVYYRMKERTTLRVEAKGYEGFEHLIKGSPDKLEPTFSAQLEPARLWQRDLGPGIRPRPYAVGNDVFTWDRAGHLALRRGDDGSEVWARHIRSVEGIRGGPAVAGGLIHVPLVEGTMQLLEIEDGKLHAPLAIDRPVGDAAALGRTVAIMSARGTLQLIESRRVARRIDLGFATTAGVVSGHGAFWIGGGGAQLVRVFPSGERQNIDLGMTRAAVRGISMHPGGILVTTGDGRLHALDASGRVRWHSEALGDVIGTAAAASGRVGAIDRRGRVLFFHLGNGAPAGVAELGAEPIGGLVRAGNFLVCALKDGRLWVHEPAEGVSRIDMRRVNPADAPPIALGDDRLVLALPDCCVVAYRIPEAPRGE